MVSGLRTNQYVRKAEIITMKTIGDFLKTNDGSVLSIRADNSVNSAIKLMTDRHVRALPVLDSGKLVGVISENDCISRVILQGRLTTETRVSEIMSSKLVMTYPAKSVEECLALMAEKGIWHLPVMTDGILVGFVSMSDLLRAMIADQKEYIYRLENYVMGVGYA